MRYHEFKIVKEGFWDSLIDLTRGGTAPQAAEKTWMTNFAQRIQSSLDNAIKSGVVNPRLTTDLNPTDASLRSPSSRTDYSISQYIYLLLEKEYRNVYASLNSQTKPLYINAINKVQDEYPTDKGKKSLFNLAGVFSSIMKTSTPDPDEPAPPPAPAPPEPSGMGPYPKYNLKIKAQVGNEVQEFTFDESKTEWKDKDGLSITDPKSIRALNNIAKSDYTP